MRQSLPKGYHGSGNPEKAKIAPTILPTITKQRQSNSPSFAKFLLMAALAALAAFALCAPALHLSAAAADATVADDGPIVPGKRSTIRFTESPIQSSDKEQVALRLSASETPPDFDITKEEFEILVPKAYDPKQPAGLFVWNTSN